MTLPYGSKQYGFREQLLEDIINPARYAAEKDPTVRFPFRNDGYFAATYLAKKIWESVSETLIKASEAMKWLQRVASIAASEQLPVRWTTAVGFPVLQAYKDVTNRRVMTAISGKVVYLTMYKEKDQLDKRKQAQGIAPNFVHSCDAAHMMLTIVRASQEHIDSFAMIHDSFGTTAGDTEALFQIVRESFVELYNTVDVLGDFRDEIVSQLTEHNQDNIPEMPSAGSLDIGQVIKSRYCFA
jgi:DNA-directed RNA polymerase